MNAQRKLESEIKTLELQLKLKKRQLELIAKTTNTNKGN